MEAAEKCRIQELKGELCRMQQSNSELKRDLTNQSKLYMDTKIEKYMIDRQVLMSETAIMEKEYVVTNRSWLHVYCYGLKQIATSF